MATSVPMIFGPGIDPSIPSGAIVTMNRAGVELGGVPAMQEVAVWDFFGSGYIAGRAGAVRRARFVADGACELKVTLAGPAIDVPVGQVVELSFEGAPVTIDQEPAPGFRLKRRGFYVAPALAARLAVIGGI